MTAASSFFTTNDNRWFTPTEHTRGPWNEHHCHAGPPTGLIARAMQHALPGQRLTRITVNLAKPIPHAGFEVEAEVTRQGKTVSHSSAAILDESGKVCASAQGMYMQPQPEVEMPSHQQDFGSPHDALEGPFPLQQSLHGQPSFKGKGVQIRYPAGENHQPGPTIAWLKTVPLLPDEEPSPFQRICPLADCGNALSRNAEPTVINFLNPDLTILLQRDPVGEWLGSQSTGYWENNGIGMADALLFDAKGVVGRALQTLLLRPATAAK